jgi:hypothetical protein
VYIAAGQLGTLAVATALPFPATAATYATVVDVIGQIDTLPIATKL